MDSTRTKARNLLVYIASNTMSVRHAALRLRLRDVALSAYAYQAGVPFVVLPQLMRRLNLRKQWHTIAE